MKIKNILPLLIISIILWSCGTSKKTANETISNDSLFNTTWELDYLSGPRIAFDGLFPDQKPTITFDKVSKKVSGNNSCNGYSADFILKENKLSFGEPGPSTLMYCGDGEVFFLKAMREINQYQVDNEGKLVLMKDNIPMMRFKPSNDKTQSMKPENNQIYFRSNGTEPFWMLEIGESGIKMTTPEETMLFPPSTAVRAMDANVKYYKTKNSDSELNIVISQHVCTNEMSGMESPYSVTITYKTQKETVDLKGCGEYITDYRLYDIWVLETLNGNKITTTDFSREFPTLEINTNTNTFMGFAGCNSMNGELFFEKGLLRFTNIVTTRMMCEPTNKEADFLLALKRSTAYEIGNNRLTLSNPEGETLVFKKVD